MGAGGGEEVPAPVRPPVNAWQGASAMICLGLTLGSSLGAVAGLGHAVLRAGAAGGGDPEDDASVPPPPNKNQCWVGPAFR